MATRKQQEAARKRAVADGISYTQALNDVSANSALITQYLTASEIASCDSSGSSSGSYDSGSSSSYDSGSSSSYDSGSSSYDSGSSSY